MRYLIGVLCVLGLAAPALGVAKDEAAALARAIRDAGGVVEVKTSE